MPFLEVKRPTGFIRVNTMGKVTISAFLIPKFFKNKTHVKVFHDKETRQIGIQPSIDGYKISNISGCFSIKCSILSRIIQGEFYPIWSKKHNMLVFSYEAKLGN